MRQYPYYTWKAALLWAHQNLCWQKDFDYSDEYIQIGGREYHWPEYFYLQEEEDLVAMKLILDMA